MSIQDMSSIRKMKGYDLNGAWIRFHNQFRPKSTLTVMTMKELADYDGQDGRPSYFSSNGLIWDVSTSKSFQEDSSYGFFKGKDATICLAKMSMNHKDVNRTDWDDLSDKEMESLHSWTRYFQEKYFIIGRLKEF